MKKKKMLVCGALGTLLGIFLLFSFQQLSKAEAMQLVHDVTTPEHEKKKQRFEDEFFESDPFENMRKFRKRFFSDFDGFSTSLDDDFFSLKDRFFNNTPSKNYSISNRETDKEVIYEISMQSDVVGDSVNVSVENGMVTISGEKEIKKTNNSDNNQSFFSSRSSFSLSFSVPQGVDSDNVKMENQDNKIILRFPKLTQEV